MRLTLQIVALIRFTFWDLLWYVMEPICFYITSNDFLAGYAFLLRTSVDTTFTTFEGLFKACFKTKQKPLMKSSLLDAI